MWNQPSEQISGTQILNDLQAEAWSRDHAAYRKVLDDAIATITTSLDAVKLNATSFDLAMAKKLKDQMRSKVITAVWEDDHVKGFEVNQTALSEVITTLTN